MGKKGKEARTKSSHPRTRIWNKTSGQVGRKRAPGAVTAREISEPYFKVPRLGHRVKWHGRPMVTVEKQVSRTPLELRKKGACSGWTQDPGYRLCEQKSGQIPALTRSFSQELLGIVQTVHTSQEINEVSQRICIRHLFVPPQSSV